MDHEPLNAQVQHKWPTEPLPSFVALNFSIVFRDEFRWLYALRAFTLIFVARIHQNQAGYIIWIKRRIEAHDRAAQRCRRHYIRTFFARRVEERLQFFRQSRDGARHRSRLTPAIAGTVVRTYAGKLGYLRLDLHPADCRHASALLQNHSG